MQYRNKLRKSTPVGFAPTRAGLVKMPLANPTPVRMAQSPAPAPASPAIQTPSELVPSSYMNHDLAVKLNWKVDAKKTDGSTDNVALKAAIVTGGRSGYTILQQGTRTYGNTEEVDVSATYGVGGTKNLTDFQGLVARRPVTIERIRLIYLPTQANAAAQLASDFVLTKLEDLDQDKPRSLSPSLLVSPDQFQLGILDFNVNFKLDEDTVLEYTVQPGQDVSIILFISGVLNTNNLI